MDIGRLLCLTGASLGLLGLLAWILELHWLTSVIPDQPPMMPNTALAVLLLGLAGMPLHRQNPGRPRKVLAVMATIVVIAIAGGTLIEYALMVDLHIDQLLLRTEGEPYPGRPSPLTALALMLLATAVLVFDAAVPSAPGRPSEGLALAASLIAFASLTGLVFGADKLYRMNTAPVIGVALPTAISLLLISVGLLLERPEEGFMRVVTSPGPGGVMLRRLTLPTLLMPAFLGLVIMRLADLDGQLFALPFAFLTATLAIGGMALVAITAVPLDRAHAALESASQRTAGILSISADAIISVDDERRITLFNQGAVQIFGWSEREAIGKPLDLLIPERFREAHRRHVASFASGSQVARRVSLNRTTIRGLRKNREEFFAEAAISKLEVGGEQILTVALRDVSEQWRAEERLELALKGANLATWDWNIETGEVLFNARWAEMRGYQPDELEPHVSTWSAGVHPDDWPRVQRALNDHFEGRDAEYSDELRVRTKSGDWIWILDRGKIFTRDDKGRPTRMAGVELDITEHKRFEQALRASEKEERFLAKLGAVLASTLGYEETLANIASLAVSELADLCIVKTTDEDGHVRRFAIAHRDPSKAELVELLRQAPLDPRQPHLASAVFETQQPLVMDEVTPEYLASIAHSDELLRTWRALDPKSLMTLPLMAHGRLVGAMILIRTTTPHRYSARVRRLAEKVALRAAHAVDNARLYQRARRAIQARDDVLGIVAHDLRNPLSIVRMQAMLLREHGLVSTDAANRAASVLERTVARMGRLIRDLLDVTAMEANRLSLERAPLCPEQLIRDAAEAQGMLAKSSELQLGVEVGEGLSKLWADRHRLLQVLENLIGNALSLTQSGGRITVGAKPGDGEVSFWVADTGPGIAAEDLPHLFDRFWQAPRARRRGAGLGLPIVKGIVEAHGGRVWVKSTLGRGSTFSFVIPTAIPTASPSAHDDEG